MTDPNDLIAQIWAEAIVALRKLRAECDALAAAMPSEGADAALAYAAMKTERDELRALLQSFRRTSHYECEDPWYSCPKHDEYRGNERGGECNCGMDYTNAAIDAALAKGDKHD